MWCESNKTHVYPNKTRDCHMLLNLWENKCVNECWIKLIFEKNPPVIRPISISDINSTIFYLDLRRGNTHVSVYFPITRMNVRVAHYEWKVAAIRFARKTGSYDRNRGSPLHLADFTNFQVIVERRFVVSSESTLKFGTSNYLNSLVEQYTSSVREDDGYYFYALYKLSLYVFLTFKTQCKYAACVISKSRFCDESSTALNVASRERGR